VKSIGEDVPFENIIKQYRYNPTDKSSKEILPSLVNKLELLFPCSKSKISERLGMSSTTLWRKERDNRRLIIPFWGTWFHEACAEQFKGNVSYFMEKEGLQLLSLSLPS
jgi:hypothetical protein